MIAGWKKRYSDILREFKYDEKKDKESAILLDSILEESDVHEKIINQIKDKTVLVIGSGPSLSAAIPKLKKYKKLTMIAADSSIKPLVENGIIPDISWLQIWMGTRKYAKQNCKNKIHICCTCSWRQHRKTGICKKI